MTNVNKFTNKIIVKSNITESILNLKPTTTSGSLLKIKV